MRIAQCLEYPIQQHGGTEVLVRELVAGLAAGHEIVLVSDDDSQAIRHSSVAQSVASHVRWNPDTANPAHAKELAAALVNERIDLAHFHFGGTFGWGSRRPGFAPPIHLARRGVPCLATNHGAFGLLEGYIGSHRWLGTKLALLLPALLSRLQLIAHLRAEVAVSQHDYRALRRRFWPLRSRFCQIYHSRIHEAEPVVIEPRNKTILCAGTVGPRKGQPYLARAFAKTAPQFPEWTLLFIGRAADDQTCAELRAIIERPELLSRVKWVPGCSDEELKKHFQTAEIFAMPSLHEGLGLTLQEALYHGCACIAFRVGGIRDLIQHGDNGILVERANASALAGGLAQLMGNDALRLKLMARARLSVLEKGMTAEGMVARYEKLYAEILNR